MSEKHGQNNMRKEIKTLVIGSIIAIVIVMLGIKSCEVRGLERENKLYKDIQDTIIKLKGKDGNQVSQIALLTDASTKLFLKVKSRDGTIIELQQALKDEKSKVKNGGSVTIINSSTNFTGTSTSTIISLNPVINGDTVRLFPVYESINKDTLWIKYLIKASKDTTTLDLQVKGKYKVVIGSIKDGWFKHKPIVEVTNYNPYTDTKSLRAFEVKDNRKNRISLGLQGGYGITLKGLSPYIGMGFNYKIL